MNRKWGSLFSVIVLMSSTIFYSGVGVAANTENSENPQQKVASSELSTVSSDILTENSSTTSEQSATGDTQGQEDTTEQTVKENDIQEVVVENSYDDRDLSNKDESGETHPFVKAQFDGETINVKIDALNESTDSKTIIKKIRLLEKTIDSEWQETKIFEESQNYVLNDHALSFEFQKPSENKSYKLVFDYIIEETNENDQKHRMIHKGYYLFEEQNSSNKGTVSGQAESSFSPYSSLQPRSSRKGATPGETSLYLGNQDPSSTHYVNYGSFSISSRDARTAHVVFEPNHSTNPAKNNTMCVVFSPNYNYITNIRGTNSTSMVLSTSEWNSISAGAVMKPLPLNEGMTNLLDGRDYYSVDVGNLQPNTQYYIWTFYRSSQNQMIGYQLPYTADFGTSDLTMSPGVYRPYKFHTDTESPLSIEKPTFNQSGATALAPDRVRIGLNGGRYTGSITQTNNQGRVQVTSDEGITVEDKVTNLGHTRTDGGQYNGVSVSGLNAGTRYRGRVSIKDGGGIWRYSEWSDYFYTPNYPNTPTTTTLYAPTATNNASALFSATYEAGGQVPAHPSSTEVQISTNRSTWTTLSTSTTPAISGTPTIDTANKSVNFKVTKLNSKTRYYVRYRIKNSSTVWSSYSTPCDFTTRGILLEISTPVLSDASTATEPRLQLAEGTYRGDPMVSGTSTDGIVRLYDSVGTSIDPITNLTSGNGIYNSTILSTGLEYGRRYKAAVLIRGSGNTREPSDISDYVYTINSVTTPRNLNYSTTQTSAAISFDGVYGVSTLGADASHPKTSGVTDSFSFDGQTGVNVQIKSDEDSNYLVWRSLKNTTTSENPAYLNSVSVNEGSKKIECNINNLKPNTTYYIRYRVQNDSGKWSYFSSDSFTAKTNGVPLSFSPPVFDQSTATANSIQLSQGTYTGDISQTPNDGIVYTESYNSNGVKDWTARLSSLQHTTTRNGTYSSATITGLTPGTRYRGWLTLKNAENTNEGPIGSSAQNVYFYTKNVLSDLSNPVLNSPRSGNDATAEFSVDYQAAGDHPDQPAAHPTNVKIYLSTDGTTFSEITTGNESPSIETFNINTENKSVSVKLKNLIADHTYYVKCSVVNQAGESDKTSVCQFTTNARQNGLYISNAPSFNFGVQPIQSEALNTGLFGNQQSDDFDIGLENVGINTEWSFSARLTSLETQDGSNLFLSGAEITFNKQLQKTSDGSNWQSVTQDFSGLTDMTVDLHANNTTTQLWRTASISAGQGQFKTHIDFDSVKLLIPGGVAQKGKYYEGKIEWVMESVL